MVNRAASVFAESVCERAGITLYSRNLDDGFMPCLCELSNAKVYIYARGEHPPPHFHLIGPDWEAIIDIRTLKVMRGSAPGSDLREAINWAMTNKRLLLKRWSELNERDD
jgi:hypothetical protein